MKKNFINTETLEGRVYQHDLTIKQVQNKESKNYGKDFISGTIDIATDEEGLNVIPVHFTYLTEMTSGGKKNATFTTLKNIIDGNSKCWITDGKEEALKVRVSTALGLNDFYVQEGDEDRLVSAKRNEGGFVNVIKDLAPEAERNNFKFDIVITNVTRVEADPENGIDADFCRIRGAVFDFRASLLPVELVCRDETGMNYFESLEASPSNPIFTEVRGNIVNNVITREIEEESAFGAASVRTVTRNIREWQVNWARPTEYTFGEEDTLTAEELQKMMQDREVYLAGVKKRRDDYLASKASTTTTTATSNVPTGNFNF